MAFSHRLNFANKYQTKMKFHCLFLKWIRLVWWNEKCILFFYYCSYFPFINIFHFVFCSYSDHAFSSAGGSRQNEIYTNLIVILCTQQKIIWSSFYKKIEAMNKTKGSNILEPPNGSISSAFDTDENPSNIFIFFMIHVSPSFADYVNKYLLIARLKRAASCSSWRIQTKEDFWLVKFSRDWPILFRFIFFIPFGENSAGSWQTKIRKIWLFYAQ